MTDQNERMNAKRKEDTGFSETVDLHDTEFAADTWREAAFSDEDKRSRRRIEYDPISHTERYQGEVDREKIDFSERLDGADRGEHRHVTVSSGKDDDVEAAAEIAEPIRGTRRANEEDDDRENGAKGIGMTGLGISILSMFLLPYLMAPIGMVLGYLAYRRNSRTLGAWAMIIGAISILGALVIYPFYTAR